MLLYSLCTSRTSQQYSPYQLCRFESSPNRLFFTALEVSGALVDSIELSSKHINIYTTFDLPLSLQEYFRLHGSSFKTLDLTSFDRKFLHLLLPFTASLHSLVLPQSISQQVYMSDIISNIECLPSSTRLKSLNIGIPFESAKSLLPLLNLPQLTNLQILHVSSAISEDDLDDMHPLDGAELRKHFWRERNKAEKRCKKRGIRIRFGGSDEEPQFWQERFYTSDKMRETMYRLGLE